MGNTPSIEYMVPVSQKTKGETSVYRNPNFQDGLKNGQNSETFQMKTALLNSCIKNQNNNCLGVIQRKQGQKDSIKFIKYREYMQQAINLGSALTYLKLPSKAQGQNLSFIGIFSKNRPEWSLVDFACILFKITTVPLYDTLGDKSISYVLNHTKLTSIFVNQQSLEALKKTEDLGQIKTIVCFDEFSDADKKYFSEKDIALETYQGILEIGAKNIDSYEKEEYKVDPQDCVTLCYTSGTTGDPKGAMLSHKNFCSFIGACANHKDVLINQNDVALSYLPLPHVLQRELDYVILANGGTIVYSSGDLSKIKQDISLVKPTIFAGVPRVFTKLYDGMNKKFDALPWYVSPVFQHGLKIKMKNAEANGGCTHKVYDPLFFNKAKQAFGGRLRFMISGSAPILPEIQRFFKAVMCVPFLEAYGQTESTGASIVTFGEDPTLGHSGGPVSNIEIKLVDVNEMSYTSQDKDQNGKQAPRGQIWMKGPGVFLGYYQDKQKTNQTLTEDGWLKTGDVGTILPETHALKIIDRKKNIFKLSQGEYIAAQKIQNVYFDFPKIDQIFLTGQSQENYAVAIVLANKQSLQSLAKEIGVEESYEDLCKNQKVRTKLLQEMSQFGRKKGLKGFQVPGNIFIETKSLQQKGVMTNTMKIQRHLARKEYKKEIQEMYKEGALKTK